MPTNWVVALHTGQVIHFRVPAQNTLHWGVYRDAVDDETYAMSKIISFGYNCQAWEETTHSLAMKRFEVGMESPA